MDEKKPKEHIFVEGKENQDRNCGWKGGGGECCIHSWKQRGKNLKVEKKEKEEQRHGSVPGAPRLPGRSHALRAGTIFPQPSAERP